MKLLKRVSRKVGKKTYYKYRVNIPIKLVKRSNFENKELKISLRRGKLVIEAE
ncbi:MAG: hypothetical protein ACFFG0_03200 [Candidatus Thorarchaeota archaeon]